MIRVSHIHKDDHVRQGRYINIVLIDYLCQFALLNTRNLWEIDEVFMPDHVCIIQERLLLFGGTGGSA